MQRFRIRGRTDPMSMHGKGLTKLLEELGELGQVAAKKLAYPDTEHPDGVGSLTVRLEDELADVIAARSFVIGKLGLDVDRIVKRAAEKLERFERWDTEP